MYINPSQKAVNVIGQITQGLDALTASMTGGAVTPAGTTAQGTITEGLYKPDEDKEDDKKKDEGVSPWVFAGVGLGVIAVVGIAAYFLTRPKPEVIYAEPTAQTRLLTAQSTAQPNRKKKKSKSR